MAARNVQIILDMDNTLLSMECLDAVIETALSAQLQPEAIAQAMQEVNREMDKGMEGAAKITETIPARLRIAKKYGAPVRPEHFEIVSRIVPNTLTQSIVAALRKECELRSEQALSISLISGGPQICVDAAAKELSKQLRTRQGAQINVSGRGSEIVLTDDGDLNQVASRISNTKVNIAQEQVEDPSQALMFGDGSMDVEVYDAGAVHYFIAIGLWVKRPFLFERSNNLPYYTKVDESSEISIALRDVLEAIQNS